MGEMLDRAGHPDDPHRLQEDAHSIPEASAESSQKKGFP